MTILGLENSGTFSEIVAHHERGTIPPTVMWGACPTLFDSSQAPAGKHTAFMWEKLPFALHGNANSWNEEREKHAQKMFNLWTEYAPNLAEALIRRRNQTPLEIQETLPNMRYGDLLVGAFDVFRRIVRQPMQERAAEQTRLRAGFLRASQCDGKRAFGRRRGAYRAADADDKRRA